MSIFSEKDPNVKVLIPRFQGGLSLYSNSNQIGFVDRELFNTYPELKELKTYHYSLDPLSIEDPTKRKIYLILKHSTWISSIILKRE
jgi:hypothetical protein